MKSKIYFQQFYPSKTNKSELCDEEQNNYLRQNCWILINSFFLFSYGLQLEVNGLNKISFLSHPCEKHLERYVPEQRPNAFIFLADDAAAVKIITSRTFSNITQTNNRPSIQDSITTYDIFIHYIQVYNGHIYRIYTENWLVLPHSRRRGSL